MRDWMGIKGSSLANPPEEKAEPICRERPSQHTRATIHRLSAAARERLLSMRGEPLFLADWERALMIHFEVGPAALQKVVPFPLDLKDGRAFVSAVAFTLARMRPRFGSRFTAWLLRPIATHDFLNVRTYVRVNGETGIYFLAEWLSSRMSVVLGPRAFGLPYRFGRIAYRHNWEPSKSSASSNQMGVDSVSALSGCATDAKTGNTLAYRANLNAQPCFRECQPGSFSEWLMERYTAFTNFGNKRRFFRVWHQPWRQTPVNVWVGEKNLLDRNWPFFRDARLVATNFSPGVRNVWMGWPHRVLS